jgi:predicted Na+-dependent transporter
VHGGARSALGVLAAGLVAVIAGVHFQQYVDFMHEVPTVGVLFLLNAAGGAGLAVAILSGDRPLRALAAMGSIGLAAGSLVSLAIALSGSFFGYHEPTLRVPILIAIIAEALVIPVLAALLRSERRGSSDGESRRHFRSLPTP